MLYYEPQPSGQTAHVLSLARGLGPKFRVTVALPSNLTECLPLFEETGARVVPLALRKVTWDPRVVSALVRLIRDLEIDLVHVHSQEAGLVGRLVARLAGARAVFYTPQTIDIRRANWHWLYTRLECLQAAITDVIISVSDQDRQRLVRWGIPPHKVITLPNGVDLAQFQGPADVQGLRSELGLSADRPVVMQVGRLSAQKDPVTFVDGAGHVLERRPDVQFVMLGDGPLMAEVVARIQERGLTASVRPLGWRAEAHRFMPAADVITLTSRWEGIPFVLLEAMAWSRPVVATTVNGCPEIVDDGLTGYLVPPGDAATWAARVLDLVDNPALAAEMGRQGSGRVKERFDLSKITGRLAELYLDVASRA
jgi:glycosyltransferase involved in cell wall biosynthesis